MNVNAVYLVCQDSNSSDGYKQLYSDLVWHYPDEADGIIQIDTDYIQYLLDKAYPESIISILRSNIGKYIAVYDVWEDNTDISSLIFETQTDVCKHYFAMGGGGYFGITLS